MLRISTAVKAAFLNSFPALFDGSVIRVYSGPIPASANAAPTGTLLAVITRNGGPVNSANGLHFMTDANGVVMRTTGEVWTLTGLASGLAGWCRLSQWNDTPIFLPAAARLDFEVGAADGIGFWLANRTMASGITQDVPYFNYSIPG